MVLEAVNLRIMVEGSGSLLFHVITKYLFQFAMLKDGPFTSKFSHEYYKRKPCIEIDPLNYSTRE